MDRKSSDFVSIPIRFIKTKDSNYEKHKDSIEKIMIRRDSVEVRVTCSIMPA